MGSFQIDFVKLTGRIRLCHSAELLGEDLLEMLKTLRLGVSLGLWSSSQQSCGLGRPEVVCLEGLDC